MMYMNEIYLIKGLINLYIICFPKKIELVGIYA